VQILVGTRGGKLAGERGAEHRNCELIRRVDVEASLAASHAERVELSRPFEPVAYLHFFDVEGESGRQLS